MASVAELDMVTHEGFAVMTSETCVVDGGRSFATTRRVISAKQDEIGLV